MRQLITRIDDELHARLKARAAAEGRTLNDLVTEALRGVLAQEESPRQWKERLLAEGKLVSFVPAREPIGLDELERRSQGWGTAVSEALDWTRGDR
ncbi:FitA-like ribbon-helix-helix domain-containing protein [Amycolatopsis panacis]|uniref:Toxin-antitoxin system HicB family antitoxin n=1 Tax=Amycolatopsis panacis TaxID=2340917 RepID=A0A419I0H2_9PSEU|nr:toxin-antitoxin system HicB family antitoxin [Amycolatopsis panacis]RJQ83153.1 toxin-antitoxin system HicB family antitoxin [Amycolatopsis panacis]